MQFPGKKRLYAKHDSIKRAAATRKRPLPVMSFSQSVEANSYRESMVLKKTGVVFSKQGSICSYRECETDASISC
jgi:hypothetical protein